MIKRVAHPKHTEARIETAEHFVTAAATDYAAAKLANDRDEMNRARVRWVRARRTLRNEIANR